MRRGTVGPRGGQNPISTRAQRLSRRCKMEDRAQQILQALVARHGPALAADPARCEALLAVALPDDPRAVHLLMVGLRAGVPGVLLGLPGAYTAETGAGLTRRLVDQFGLAEPHARWTVDSWAVAILTRLPVLGPRPAELSTFITPATAARVERL